MEATDARNSDLVAFLLKVSPFFFKGLWKLRVTAPLSSPQFKIRNSLALSFLYLPLELDQVRPQRFRLQRLHLEHCKIQLAMSFISHENDLYIH